MRDQPLFLFQSLNDLASYFRYQCCYLKAKRPRQKVAWKGVIGWPRVIYKLKSQRLSLVRCRWETVLDWLIAHGYRFAACIDRPYATHVLCDVFLYITDIEPYLRIKYDIPGKYDIDIYSRVKCGGFCNSDAPCMEKKTIDSANDVFAPNLRYLVGSNYNVIRMLGKNRVISLQSNALVFHLDR